MRSALRIFLLVDSRSLLPPLEMLIAIGQRFTDHPETVATAEKLAI